MEIEVPSTVNSFNSLRFPQDLGTSEVPFYIRFEPQVVNYGGSRGLQTGTGNFDLRSAGNRGRNNPSQSPVSTGRDFSVGPFDFTIGNIPVLGVIDSIASSVNSVFDSLTSGLQSFTSNIFNGGLGGIFNARLNINSATLNRGVQTDPNTVFSPGSINLYLPENLQTNSSVDYSATELGQMGMGAVDTIRQSGLDSFRTDGEGRSMLDGLTDLIPKAFQDMSQSDDRLQAAFSIARGQVSNNFSFQIFQGVGHRSFSYSFNLVARDEGDSAKIKEICDTFVFYMLPSKTSGDFNFYEVPCQWNISYNGPGGKLSFHQQPKPCFLSSVNVGYNGKDEGSSLYNDGAPMSVQLELEFVEIEPLYRGDRVTGASR